MRQVNVINSYGPCPYVCNNKSQSGWCATTACINSEYNGNGRTIVLGGVEYCAVKKCPNCGRLFTENMICECGQNNAYIRL